MLYVPIHIIHIKRYLLLDKFQIEIRKKWNGKQRITVIIISTIMLKV